MKLNAPAVRSRLLCAALLSLTCWQTDTAECLAQGAEETKTGIIEEVVQKGRNTTLKIKDDQIGSFEVLLTPKIEFQIQAPGDKGFVAAGNILQAQGVMTNEQIFISKVTIRLVPAGTRSTFRGQVTKAPPKPGQSQNAYLVSGVIEESGPDPDYADYLRVTLKGVRGPALMLEKNVEVTLSSDQIDQIPDQAPVSVEGTLLRNGKFTPSKVTVRASKAWTSSDAASEK